MTQVLRRRAVGTGGQAAREAANGRVVVIGYHKDKEVIAAHELCELAARRREEV
jgi:hypothetical protein